MKPLKIFLMILCCILLLLPLVVMSAEDDGKDVPDSISIGTLTDVQADLLVPAPSEIKAALKVAKIDLTAISKFIGNSKYDFDKTTKKENKIVLAGMLLADILLSIDPADQGKSVLSKLENLKVGFKQIGVGDDVLNLIDNLKVNIEKKAFSSKELVPKLDEMRPKVLEKIQALPDGQMIVLGLEAGGWAKGVNVLAQSIKSKGAVEGTDLLIQPHITKYFLNAKEKDKLPTVVITSLLKIHETITTIDGQKKTKLEPAEVQIIIDETNKVMSQI
jgi:hypothetical protein